MSKKMSLIVYFEKMRLFVKMIKYNGFLILLSSWLLCIPVLIPVPDFYENIDEMDIVIWAGYAATIIVGIFSVVKLYKGKGKIGFIFFSLSIAMYFGLGMRSDLNVYIGIWDLTFKTGIGNALTWNLVLTGGRGWLGGIQTILYCFVIPLVFIFQWILNFKIICGSRVQGPKA